jgi:hypothetical protein
MPIITREGIMLVFADVSFMPSFVATKAALTAAGMRYWKCLRSAHQCLAGMTG